MFHVNGEKYRLSNSLETTVYSSRKQTIWSPLSLLKPNIFQINQILIRKQSYTHDTNLEKECFKYFKY